MAFQGVNSEMAAEVSGRLQKGEEELDGYANDTAKMPSALEACWEGSDADSCQEYVNNLVNELNQMSAEVAKIRGHVENYANDVLEMANANSRNYA